MKSFFVLGIDPGLANCGVAVLEVSYDFERLVYMEVLRTKPSHKKLKVLVSDDVSRRLAELVKGLVQVFETYQPRIICAEALSFPRSASPAAKVGMAWGLAVAMAALRGVPFLQVTPQQIKKKVTGKMSASKGEVQVVLEGLYPVVEKLKARKIPGGQQEHPVDALAAIVTCFDSDAMRGARAGLDV